MRNTLKIEKESKFKCLCVCLDARVSRVTYPTARLEKQTVLKEGQTETQP